MNLRRKRLRLMRDTQWRGYARTAEGNPITLSQIRSVLSLSVLGNSSQSGTPSPDNPVDVIGTGERTGNLFDISQVGDTNTLYNDGRKLKVTAYSNSTNLSVEKFLAMTGLKPGDVFTAARQYEVINGIANSATGSIRFNRRDGSGQFFIIPGNKDVAINVVPDDFNSDIYSDINFYGANSGDLKEVIFSNIQILKGSYTADTLPPYEPYGYKVAVTASGRNLFDLDNASDGNNWAYSAAKDHAYYDIPDVGIGNKYTVCLKLKTPIEISSVAVVMNSISNVTKTVINLKSADRQIKTLIYEEGDCFDIYSPGTNGAFKILQTFVNSDIAIYKGAYTAETLPPYEPYKPPQSFNVYSPDVLHGVGAAHDTVILDFDKHKAELTQKIGISQFKNSDAWRDEYFPVLYKPLSPNMIGSSYAMCNYAEYMPTAKVPAVRASNIYGTAIGMYNSDKIQGVTDGDSFKTWLSDKDVYAYYPLATSTTTDITSLQDWDALPQLHGTWILTATGGTEPTLLAEYYSNERSTE